MFIFISHYLEVTEVYRVRPVYNIQRILKLLKVPWRYNSHKKDAIVFHRIWRDSDDY